MQRVDGCGSDVAGRVGQSRAEGLSEVNGGGVGREMARPVVEQTGGRKGATPRPGWTLVESAEGIRQRQKIARSRTDADGDSQRSRDDALSEFNRGVVARAMAQPPEEWSEVLKAAIARFGWNLDEFAEGIRQRKKTTRSRTDAYVDSHPSTDGSPI